MVCCMAIETGKSGGTLAALDIPKIDDHRPALSEVRQTDLFFRTNVDGQMVHFFLNRLTKKKARNKGAGRGG